MKSSKLFLGGLFAMFSLSAPVFAAPTFTATAKADARVTLHIGQAPAPVYVNRPNENVNAGYDKIEPKGQYADRYEESSRYDEKLEARVLALVNDVRLRNGLNELRLDTRGTLSARESSAEASRESGFGRISTSVETRLRNQGIQSNYQTSELTRFLKDNNTNETARKIVQAWLKDKKQSRVLLDGDLTYVGIGAVTLNGKSAVTLDAFGPKRVIQPSTPAVYCD